MENWFSYKAQHMKHILLIFILAGITGSLIAQEADSTTEEAPVKENVWKTLSKITYKKEYDEFLGFKIDKPVFRGVS